MKQSLVYSVPIYLFNGVQIVEQGCMYMAGAQLVWQWRNYLCGPYFLNRGQFLSRGYLEGVYLICRAHVFRCHIFYYA